MECFNTSPFTVFTSIASVPSFPFTPHQPASMTGTFFSFYFPPLFQTLWFIVLLLVGYLACHFTSSLKICLTYRAPRDLLLATRHASDLFPESFKT